MSGRVRVSIAPQKRLLIVEDESVVAFDLTVALEAMGYTVVGTAASADEAFRTADTQWPDLVLMDINIAGCMDGIDAGCRLRARHGVPLVYLTANVDSATLSRALVTEPAGYLVKPYNEHSLRTTIEVALSRHEAEQAARIAHQRERAQLEEKYSAMTTLARRLRRDATRDMLTGLCNRRQLGDVAQRVLSFAQRDRHAVGLILIDLDRFKLVTDTVGLAGADAMLRAVADLVQSRIRSYDIACRLGGDEIVVLVPGESTAGAATLAERLRAAIETLEIPSARGRLPRVTASFGVSSFPEHGGALDGMLSAADNALRRAKTEGRNAVVKATAADAATPSSWADAARAWKGRAANERDGRASTGQCALVRELDAGDDTDV